MEKLSDSEIEALVSRYAVGRKSGWHYLLTVAKNKASLYVSRDDVEDVAQDAFIVLYNKLQEGVIIRNPAGFITKAAHWKCLDRLKKKDPLKLRKLALENEDGAECALLDSIADEKCIMPGLESRTELAGLTDYLKRIEPPCPEILKKHHLERRAHKEVAEVLAIPAGNIRVKTARCLNNLRNVLKTDNPSLFKELSELAL
jgi:RNA polymerase sigma factor (sigma-70 family)